MRNVIAIAILAALIAVTLVSTASAGRHHRAPSGRCDWGINLGTGQLIRYGTNTVTGYAVVNGTDSGDGNVVRCFR